MTSTLTDPTEPDYPAAVRMTTLRGSLPPRPRNFTVTPGVNRVRAAVETSARLGMLATVSGPVGVGKTTAVAEAGRAQEREVVFVTLHDTTSAKASLQVIWECLTHTDALGSEKQIRDSILQHLLRHDLTLLIDDAHYISKRALRVLTGIWNEIHNLRGHGIHMVLVGNDLHQALKNVPEIGSRVAARVEAQALGGDNLYAALAVLEPRTALTDRHTLAVLDRQHFKGEIRKWVQFLDIIRLQHAQPVHLPLDDTEIRTALLRQGWL